MFFENCLEFDVLNMDKILIKQKHIVKYGVLEL